MIFGQFLFWYFSTNSRRRKTANQRFAAKYYHDVSSQISKELSLSWITFLGELKGMNYSNAYLRYLPFLF